ncbi:hypothetical protein [Clostridium oryzae]|uniref:Uncharacterized protein n=1 Tax=Clostridium oryzae TaxID=1450648 RepID=A0A1V4IID3_9CLOT|nr:hypothetical protein [Clostridium oryzae]OPJ59768.1 hypothetical protein CLORY_31130 [Clostridium oryzae]
MNNVYILLVMAWVSAISFFIYFYIKKKKKKSERAVNLFNGLYKYIIKLPIINKEIIEIKKRLYDNNLWDERMLRYKALLYYAASWFAAVLCFAFVIFYFYEDKFEIFTLSIFCYYVKIIVLEHLIGDDTKLLNGLNEFNEDLIHDYQLQRDIDKSVEQAQYENSSMLLINHIENMKPALDSLEDLDNYFNECSNDYLRLTALNCSLTKEFGDTAINEDESSFTANIKHFNRLIKMELFKRRQLKYWLGGAALFCIVPLLGFTPFDSWVNKFAPFLKSFYCSSWGFIIKLFLTMVTLVFFYMIRNYRRVDYREIREKKYYWEDRLLKVKFIRLIIDRVKPKKGTKRFYYYRKLINKSQTHTKFEWVFLHRIIISILVFFFMLTVAFTIHRINYQNDVTDYPTIFGNDVITVNGQQLDAGKLIKDTSLKLKNVRYARINAIKQSLIADGLQDKVEINKLSANINTKIDKLNNEYIKWYEILACFLIAVVSSWIPIWYLKLKVKSNSYNMQSELMTFETIIMVLMNFEDSTIDKILIHMSRFAHIFKNPIDDAIFNLQKGTDEALGNVITGYRPRTNEEEALTELMEKVDYKPFKNLIKNLMKVEDIKVAQAFSNLSSYRNEYAKEREEENKKVVAKRVSRGRMLSLIPYFLVVFLYVIAPMMIVTNNSYDKFNDDIANELINSQS